MLQFSGADASFVYLETTWPQPGANRNPHLGEPHDGEA